MQNFILKDENAVFYECGYSCDNAIFLNLDGKKFFLTDSRYAIEAAQFCKNTTVIESEQGLIKDTRLFLRKKNIKVLHYNPRDFNVADFENLQKGLNVRFKAIDNFSQISRLIKNEEEIKNLKEAANLGAKCFDEFAEFVRKNGEGMSEEELFFNAEMIFKQQGKLALSFSPIVAINENTAKAHALPGKKRLKFGDLLLLDAGVKFNRYCSDRTRTACFDENFNFSKQQKFKNSKQQEIYEIVKQAQEIAIGAIEIGKKASDIDAVARNFIAKNGFEKEFSHSTGHGVGVDIHELPNISKRGDIILKEGMVFSVEPGIYLKDEFGVRIEDVVVVRQNGAEIL
ncbi:MAG: M24 family metallopeptidase [Campylobacter sp.]